MPGLRNDEKGIETASYSVSAANHFFRSSNLTLAASIGHLFKPVTESLVRYLFLPVNVVTSILTAAFSWRRTYLNGFKAHSLTKAILETVTACAMCAAMIGAITATAIFSVVTPAISASTVAAKGLFNLGSSIYFGVNANYSVNDADKVFWKKKAKSAALEGVVGLVIVAALVTLILFASPAVKLAAQIIGITGSVMACGIALKKIHDSKKMNKENKFISTDARMSKRFHGFHIRKNHEFSILEVAKEPQQQMSSFSVLSMTLTSPKVSPVTTDQKTTPQDETSRQFPYLRI